MTNRAPSGTRRLLRCSVGAETYFIDNDWLDSIQVIDNLYPSRGENGSIGWIRRFDEKVPVFRLADQIHSLSRSSSRTGVILVLKNNRRLWALLVDKVMGAGEITSERVQPLPLILGESNRSRFPYVIAEDEGMALFIAPDQIVPQEISGAHKRAHPASQRFSQVRSAMERGSAGRLESPAGPGSLKTGRQIITFTVQHGRKLATTIRFAVSAGQALEIISDPPMIPVPDSPPFVIGLANWRNLPVPVMNLAAAMGMPSGLYQPGSRLLIARGATGSGRNDTGLIAIAPVDEIQKLELPIEYTPWKEAVTWNTSLALGIYRLGRSMLVVPDLDALSFFHERAPAYRM